MQSHEEEEYVEHRKSLVLKGEFSFVHANISDQSYIKTVFFIASFCVSISF